MSLQQCKLFRIYRPVSIRFWKAIFTSNICLADNMPLSRTVKKLYSFKVDDARKIRKNATNVVLWRRSWGTTARCYSFLESSRRLDVMYRCDLRFFFEIFVVKRQKSVSERPKIARKPPFLTPHFEIPKDVASKRGEPGRTALHTQLYSPFEKAAQLYAKK